MSSKVEPEPEPEVEDNTSVITEEPKANDSQNDKKDLAIGLAELEKTDKIVIQQMSALMDSCCGYEGENMFEISDRLGHVILRATEDSNCCSRQCCERLRPFEMIIKDRQSKTVIKMTRPHRCDNCICCPCLNQTLHVECPPGNYVGFVEQNISVYRPTFDIFAADGETKKYIIEGPSTCKSWLRSVCNAKCCFCLRKRCFCCGKNIMFKILNMDGDKVGDLQKLWAGPLEKQRGLDAFDRFGIDFPDDAELDIKVVLVASCFLIDYLYFEGDEDDDD